MSGSRNFSPEVVSLVTAAARNGLAPRQGLAFDGSNVAVNATLSSAPGTTPATIAFEFDVPTSNPSVFNAIVHLATARAEGTANELGVGITSGGVLQVFKRGATSGDWLTASVTANLVTAFGGTRVRATITRNSTTLVIYLNGVSAAFTEATAGAFPTWATTWDGTLLTIGRFGNGLPFTGVIGPVYPLSRALTAAEVLALYQNGAPAAGDYRDPAQPFDTSLVTSNNSNFAGAGGWSGSGVTVSGGQMTVTGYALLYSAGVIKGKRYRMVMDVVSNPTTIIFDDGGSSRYSTITGTGSTTVDFLCGNSGLVELFPTAGGTMVIDNFTIYPIGLLCAPESNAPGNGLVWNDLSGNGAHILLPHVSGKMTGVTWALPGGGRNSVSGTTNTLGNQQIFGAGSVVFDAVGGNPTCRIARVFARARTGTPSVTLGYTSGGNQYATATTLAVGWKVVAAGAESVAATTSLWAGSSSADVVEWMVMIEPIKF
jgi:hypothetical protein